MIAATCPPPTGYVAQLCTNHPAFHPSQHLAYTGTNPGLLIALALALIMAGAFVVVAVVVRARKDAQA